VARSDVHPKHTFESWQVWPGSYDNPPADGSYPFAGQENSKLVINRETPIASMGSCFAREIKYALLRKGFAYIAEEQEHPASKHASAAWERCYNVFSMLQIFKYTFESWSPRLRWWQCPLSGQIQDPYRRIVLYNSLEEAQADFDRHRRHSRHALEKASVLILTLGMTEIWEDREDGAVIAIPSGPYVDEGGDMNRYRFRVSRFNETLETLEQIHAILSAHNPNCKLVLTVSPVHLWATFRTDMDVISAGCNSKATLRAAVDEFAARYENVYYFPAYEMATIYMPIMKRTYLTEDRENFHINQETIDFIMDQFDRFYCREA
jgi:hypothetical protein